MLNSYVGSIIKRRLRFISPTAPVYEAIRLMGELSISCVPVLEDGKPVGILTERSIVRLAFSLGQDFVHRPVSEVMSSPVQTIKANDRIFEAYSTFMTAKIRHLVVVDDAGMAMSVLTQSDMIEHIFREYFSEYRDISRIMSRTVFTLEPGTSLDKVLAEMVEQTISCVVIAEGGKPLGILTERDIARFVADGGEVAGRLVDEVMHAPVATAPMDVPVYEATRIMRNLGIRRLVIVDEQGELAGLLTQSDIIKGIEDKYIQILKDVIREKDAELEQSYKELREKSLYLDCILKSSIDLGIVAADESYNIILYNPAAQAILGQDEAQVLGKNILAVHERIGLEPDRFEKVATHMSPGTQHNFLFELSGEDEPRLIQANMSGIWREGSVRVGYVLMLRDITEQRKAEEAVAFLAYHDGLTGLPNRTLLGERLAHELTRAERYGTRLAILMADIDRFKSTNDLLGHAAGDTVLRTVAARMTESLRRSDTVARIGGDEFLLVLPEVGGLEEAVMIADKVRDLASQEVEIEGKMVPVSLSIGIALYPDNGKSAKTLFKAADDAMYRAKELNRINSRSNVAAAPIVRN